MKHLLSMIATLALGATFLSSVTTVVAQSLAPQQSTLGVSYINGGVGYDEAKQIESKAAEYPLWLLFSEGECGRSVSNVDVQIEKGKEVVFALSHAGPQLLVDLPKGDYKVIGTYQHKQQGARFSLKENVNKKVVLNWKNCVEEDSLDLPEKHEE